MPTENLFPAIRYRNPDRALEWLIEVFGFGEKAVYRPYGSRAYSVRDLEGNAWSFGTHNPHDA
jgi:uncharacterized glyoxalase superfamily protein PhnB